MGSSSRPNSPSNTKTKIIKMFSPNKQPNTTTQIRLKSPRLSNYAKIANDEDEETENEIADALIDIIEDVVCSGPYNPTQQVKSRSLSRRKRYNKSKRRRPSNKSNVFPRERIHKTKTKSKSKVESLTSDSVLCSSDMFDHE